MGKQITPAEGQAPYRRAQSTSDADIARPAIGSSTPLVQSHRRPGQWQYRRGSPAERRKVIGALLSRGFADEVVVDDTRPADHAPNTLWRNLEDGRAVLLRITAAGLDTIGVESATALGATEGDAAAGIEPDSAPGGGSTAALAEAERQGSATVQESPAPRPEAQTGKSREGTKQAQLIAMLKRPEGATIEQIVEATGWPPHNMRGPLAGAVKKHSGSRSPRRRS